MIWAALFTFLFYSGGGGTFGKFMADYVEAPLTQVVSDDKRRKKALDTLDGLKDDLHTFNDDVQDDTEAFGALLKDYDSTPEAFDRLTAAVFQKGETTLEALWEDRSKMLENLTAEEWNAVVTKAEAAQKTAED